MKLFHKKTPEQKATHLQYKKRIETYKDAIMGDTYLSMITPKRGWRLHEDYVEVLNPNKHKENTVIAPVFIFIKSDKTDLDSQWGVDFIQDLVSDTIKHMETSHNLTITFIENIRPMTNDWIKKHQSDSDRYTAKQGNDHRHEAHVFNLQNDLTEIAQELDVGSSYLAVGLKYVIAAINLKTLDDFLISLQRRLELRIPGVIVTLANGHIEKEFANIFNNPIEESGKKLMFTSEEFAGFYNLVTNGIEDPNGVYVGEQIGDISNAAVIWDMTYFDNFAILASGNNFARKRDFARTYIPDDFKYWSGSDLWLNTLIMQLVKEQPISGRKHHVFTLALDPIHLDDHLITSTSTIDLNKGHLNPFEVFGDEKDELKLYAANLAKWHEMTRQLAEQSIQSDNEVHEATIDMRELTDLDDILNQFYIDTGMWVANAKENRDKIHLVGVPSPEIPRLNRFIAYLVSKYSEVSDPVNGDPRKANEYNILLSLYRQLDLSNGDIFDTVTDPQFSTLGIKPHTLFNYSELSQRKGNILLVQLLNSISAIANQTHEGDVIIIHGAQRITGLAQKYIEQIIDDLLIKHVRVVFSYSSSAEMLKQLNFNHMSEADWVLTGRLTADQASIYNKALGNQRQMTPMVLRNIQSKNDACYYLRRGSDNIIFEANQAL